jgi:hypothetical protein
MQQGTHRTVPLSSLKRRHTRRDPGTKEELQALGRSWLGNPIHDILVDATMSVVDGNRRLLGLELLEAVEVNVCVLDDELSNAAMDDVALLSSYHRAPLGGYEQARIVRDKKEAVHGMTNKAVADYFHIDPGMITRLLSLFDCIPEAEQAAKDGLLNVSQWYAISKAEDQREALRRALHGASRDALEESRGRVKKFRCPLPSGHVVTVAGDNISTVDEGIKILMEAVNALKAALKGKKKTIKEAQAMWADEIAKGKDPASGNDGPESVTTALAG